MRNGFGFKCLAFLLAGGICRRRKIFGPKCQLADAESGGFLTFDGIAGDEKRLTAGCSPPIL